MRKWFTIFQRHKQVRVKAEAERGELRRGVERTKAARQASVRAFWDEVNRAVAGVEKQVKGAGNDG